MTTSNILGFRTASEMLQRGILAMKAGLTFGGKRDVNSALGYKTHLTFSDYWVRYKRGGIAKRIVEAYPKGTWRKGVELIENEDPNVITEFEKTFTELNERLNIWNHLMRADILAGVGRYSGLLLGFPGDLKSPVRKGRPEDLLYLAPYSEDELEVGEMVTDSQDERFGLPKSYFLTYKGRIGSIPTNIPSREVHWTRILHVSEDLLDDPLCGTPMLEAVWNDLDNLVKVVGGGAEAYWQMANQGLFFNIDPEAMMTPEQIKEIKEQSAEFAHGMKRTMAIRGAEMQALGADTSDFGPNTNAIISLISGTTGIPQRILLGSERGQLASVQDKDTWDSRLQDRRDDHAEPLVRRLVAMLQRAGVLPVVKFKIAWPDMEDINISTRATVAGEFSKLNKNMGAVVITAAEVRDKVLRLPKLTGDFKDELEAAKAANKPAKAAPTSGTHKTPDPAAPPKPSSGK